MTIPIVVIVYNQLYFLRKFIDQIKHLPNPIIILDNKSEYAPLFEYYNQIASEKITVHRLPQNYGHTVHEHMRHYFPNTELYILTDPDLELSSSMPRTISDILVNVSEEYKTFKLGLALDISDSDKFIPGDYGTLVKTVESTYYEKQIDDPTYTLYDAPTDTTFCLINWKFKEENKQIRIGGKDFTAKHLPWYNNYLRDNVPKDELACWIRNNGSSSILRYIDPQSLLLSDDLEIYAEKYPNDKYKKYREHDYITNYKQILKPYQTSAKTVVEIGIGDINHESAMQRITPAYRMGNSLRMWRDYFSNAHIYGLDISETAMITNEPRITTLIANQSSHVDLYNVVKTIAEPIDVIIDDGAHIAEYQITSFKFLEKFLKEGGVYIIEDIQPPHIDSFLDLSIFGTEYRKYILDNYEFTYFDTRSAMNKPDDILLVFKKKVYTPHNVILFDNIADRMLFNYNNYIFDLLNKRPLKRAIHIGPTPREDCINIYINFEHKLVKRWYIDGGDVEILANDEYLIPMNDYKQFAENDIVFDYSIPNILHMNKSSRKDVLNKQVYIPPLVFEFDRFTSSRSIDALTTFYQPGIYRRDVLLERITRLNICHRNISNCFLPSETIQLLKNTKVLVNIHQKEHCNSFEELRCLPALLCGTLVIAEESPYKDAIPYSKFIIWSSYDNIAQTLQHVLSNYEEYYARTFVNSDIERVFAQMRNDIEFKLQETIKVKYVDAYIGSDSGASA